MGVPLHTGADSRVAGGQLGGALVEGPAHGLDVLAVGLDEGHGDQVGQAGQLLLTVGHQGAELGQAVEGAAGEDPAGGIAPAAEALAGGYEVRREAVFAEQEQPVVPGAGLDLVAQNRRVAVPAGLVGGPQVLRRQADAAVVHQDNLVAEAGGLVGCLVPCPDGLPEGGLVVDGHGHHLIEARALGLLREVRPQSPQGLGDHRGAVVIPGEAAGVVGDHQEHRDPARVGDRLAVDLIEPGQHHLQRRLHRQGAGLQVDDAAEHTRLAGGQHLVHRRVVGVQAVGRGDQPPLQQPGDIAPGVVVGGVGNPQGLGPLDQPVAREVVAQRDVVVLALAGEVDLSVLAHPEGTQPAQGGGGAVLGGAVGARGGAVQLVREGGGHLGAHKGHQLLLPGGEGLGVKIHRLVGQGGQLLIGPPGQGGPGPADGVDVRLAQKAGQGMLNIANHGRTLLSVCCADRHTIARAASGGAARNFSAGLTPA